MVIKKKIYLLLLVSFIFTLGLNTSRTQQILPIDPANMDLSIKPGDDFFNYASGTWIKNNPMPPDKTRYGAFDELAENNLKQLKELVEELASNRISVYGSNAQKIGDLYASAMDSAKIESLGTEPIKPFLEGINNIRSFTDLTKYTGYLHSYRIFPLFSTGAGQDIKNSEMTVLSIRQNGYGLGDRDYFLKDDERSKEIRAEYLKHITKIFELKGDAPETASVKAGKILEMEIKLAEISYSRYDLRETEKNYYKSNTEELNQICPEIDWNLYFTELGISNPGDIIIGQKSYFEGMNEILKKYSLDDWKGYLEWNLLRNLSNHLNSAFVNQNFEFYEKFFTGQKEMRPRWKRALELVNGMLGEALGEIYVAKYFPPKAKSRMNELVVNLKDAFSERIKNLSWMTDATKEKALDKLSTMNVKVGYPDRWRDYSELEIDRESYLSNYLRASKFNYLYSLSKAGKPVERDRWFMTPQTVNAYYSATMNEIVFPAGILQPPFFFMDADDAVNYGGIGVVIGHEMTHGFDDRGRKFDKNGNFNDWWSETDAEQYSKISEVLVEQFNNFVINDSLNVDGKLTLGENISDLGGVTLSLHALKNVWSKNPPQEKIDGFTPLQRFFLSYAQIWRGSITDKELMRRLKEDSHSPSIARVNGTVYNIPEFYEAFGIQPADKYFRAAELRAVIW